MSQMPWKLLKKKFSSQIGGLYLRISMLTSRLSWDVPNNAALFRGPTVWQLAVQPDGLAAHPNISLCCIQRPFQEGWQQKCMLEINSLFVSFQGKSWNCMKAPPELQMLWLEVLIRSVNRCKPKGHTQKHSCKGTWTLKHLWQCSSHVILHGTLLSAPPHCFGKPRASNESILAGCNFALLLNGPGSGGGVLSSLPWAVWLLKDLALPTS